MFCSNCGKEITKKDKYCPNCGWDNALYNEIEESDFVEPELDKQETKTEEVKADSFQKNSVSKTLAILSIVFAFFSSLLGLGFGIYVVATEKNPEVKKLGIIGLVLSIVMMIVYFVVSYFLMMLIVAEYHHRIAEEQIALFLF